MNPTAAEFVPSWLPAPEAEPSAETSASAKAATKQEPPDSWEDEVGPPAPAVAPPVAEAAALSVNGDGSGVGGDDSGGVGGGDDVAAKKPPRADVKSVPVKSEEASVPVKREGAVGKGNPSATAAGKASAGTSAGQVDPTLGTDAKKPLNVVLLGHVDAGKSTISGNLLYLTGNVDDRTMEKYEKEAKALNRESWKYAFALDSSEQERAKGKTEEYGQAAFTTETRRFTIIDAPGHKNYVPHMIGGASQADIGILVISARKGEFETGFERGGQTREHAMLAKTSGIRQIVVVINKLDDPSVLNQDKSWNEERFLECKNGLEPYLRQVGWNIKEIAWIPVSGMGGQNLKDKAPEKLCPWYRGDALLGHLDKLKLPARNLQGAVKMPISERHKEMGTMVKGKLESGVIRQNDKLVMMPNKVDVVVDAVELESSDSNVAEPGDNVRLRLKGIEDEEIRIGFVLCSPHDLVSYTNTFDAQLMILEHKSIICPGYSAVMHVHQVEVECTLVKLLGELDKKTGKISKKNPRFVRPGMKCIARMQTNLPVCIEPFKTFPQLGRFSIRDEGKTIAVGVVLKIKELKSAADQAASEDA